jgi:hypothetical protein
MLKCSQVFKSKAIHRCLTGKEELFQVNLSYGLNHNALRRWVHLRQICGRLA